MDEPMMAKRKGNVIGLRGPVNAAMGPPDEELVSSLAKMLADAKSGYLRAIGWVGVDRDRGVHTSWAGHCDLHDMTAGVAILQHRFMAEGATPPSAPR